jgi:hypothetical protein
VPKLILFATHFLNSNGNNCKRLLFLKEACVEEGNIFLDKTREKLIGLVKTIRYRFLLNWILVWINVVKNTDRVIIRYFNREINTKKK